MIKKFKNKREAKSFIKRFKLDYGYKPSLFSNRIKTKYAIVIPRGLRRIR